MQSRNRYVCMNVCKEANTREAERRLMSGVWVGWWLADGLTDRSNWKEEVGR